jgi:hypothetical protein
MPDIPSPEASTQQVAPLTASDPTVAASGGDTTNPAPSPETPPAGTDRPLLTTLAKTITNVTAQGQARPNPLAIPNASVLPSGASGTSGGAQGQAISGVGSTLKQLGDAVKSAVDSVVKPKATAAGDAE